MLEGREWVPNMSCILPEFLFLKLVTVFCFRRCFVTKNIWELHQACLKPKSSTRAWPVRTPTRALLGLRVEMQSILSTEQTLSGKQSTSEKLSSTLWSQAMWSKLQHHLFSYCCSVSVQAHAASFIGLRHQGKSRCWWAADTLIWFVQQFCPSA